MIIKRTERQIELCDCCMARGQVLKLRERKWRRNMQRIGEGIGGKGYV